MRVLITLNHLGLGGTETYSVTVAEQLERLGHPTRLHAGGAQRLGRELAASRGLELSVGDPATIERVGEVDGVIAQDAAAAYALAARRDDLPQAFVVHGLASFEHPAGALDPAPPVVALNERIATRARALSAGSEVVRLRQPIDLERHRPRTPSRLRARRLLVLGNFLDDGHLRMLEEACAGLGLELARVGAQSDQTVTPEDAIDASDIVVGYGRSALEGMSMGRATYVWGHAGGDGWVTPETYPALEADGFSGAASGATIDAGRLREDLAAYRPEMGTLGYDLVRAGHSAAKHAEALVGVLGRAAPPRKADALATLSMLVRSETRWMHRAGELEHQSRQLAEQVTTLGAEAESLREQAAAVESLRERTAAAEAAQAAEAARAASAEGLADAVLGSWSWRLTAPLRKLASRLREPGRP